MNEKRKLLLTIWFWKGRVTRIFLPEGWGLIFDRGVGNISEKRGEGWTRNGWK